MKGIVFTEFLEMVEDAFSPDTADQIIDAAGVDGAYTSVGTYEACELAQLVKSLSETAGTPVPDLLKTFGRHMFTRFVAGYPQMFEGVDDATALLAQVHNHIHVEVRKLYPDAELPVFHSSHDDDGAFVLDYESDRPFADFAHGLIEGCIQHFGGRYAVQRTDPDGTGQRARFVLAAAA